MKNTIVRYVACTLFQCLLLHTALQAVEFDFNQFLEAASFNIDDYQYASQESIDPLRQNGTNDELQLQQLEPEWDRWTIPLPIATTRGRRKPLLNENTPSTPHSPTKPQRVQNIQFIKANKLSDELDTVATTNPNLHRAAPPQDGKEGIETKEDELQDQAGTRWKKQELQRLFDALLAPENINRFQRAQNSQKAKKVWEEVSMCLVFVKRSDIHLISQVSATVFGGKRTPTAVQRKWEECLKVYKEMVIFESWTGGRQGDPDTPLEGQCAIRLENAKTKGGKSFRLLDGEKAAMWTREGWFEMFANRCVCCEALFNHHH
jgi:hypothetical protein